MTNIVSKFEQLPNELLLDIFSYCRPRDLFISLFNLNQRLNTLISIQTLHIDLGNALPKYLLDIYYQSILYNARKQIHTLRLSDTYGRMNRFVCPERLIGIDFPTRELIFNRVKCLILWDPIMSSLHEILKYIQQIEYFQVTSIGRARLTPNYSDQLLKNLFRIKSLKRVSLALHDSIIFNSNIEINYSITHLTLNGCYMQDLAPILRRLPNLQRLNIMCYNRPNISIINQYDFDWNLYDDLADSLPYLTHLSLNITHTPFYEIRLLLQQLPNLIKLSFSSLLIEEYSNGFNWQNLIENYLSRLQKFSLFINESHMPARMQIDLKKIIESFSTDFWRRWPVTFEYYSDSLSKKHLILYTLPSPRDSIRTYLHGIECQSSREWNCIDEMNKSDYKKVSELHLTLHSKPPSFNVLTDRIYSNLKSLSFSSELLDSSSLTSETILIDLQKICSTTSLNSIKRIYLYNHHYPNDFLEKLLNLLPNVQSLRTCAELFDLLSTNYPRLTSLTIDLNSDLVSEPTNILRQIGKSFSNLRYLYFELKNALNIYIYLIYCLRKFVHLLDIHVTLHETHALIDEQAFLLWFNDFKSYNGLNQRIQVEFADELNRLHISL